MTKRREFLMTTGAALSGIAISGIIPAEAAAEEQKTAVAPAATQAMAAKKCGTINIHAPRGGVKIDGLIDAVKQALGRVGCPGCGLLGVDIHIGGGDPEPFGNVGGVNINLTPMG